jgi:hypothetical protein
VSLIVLGRMETPKAIAREIFDGRGRFLKDALAEDKVDALDVTEMASDALYVGWPPNCSRPRFRSCWRIRLTTAAGPRDTATTTGPPPPSRRCIS